MFSRFDPRLVAAFVVACCLLVASPLRAQADRSSAQVRARQMLERAWAEVDTTTTIELNDSIAVRVGPNPKAAVPESLRVLADLLVTPRDPGAFDDLSDTELSIISAPALADSAAARPRDQRVLIRLQVSPLGIVERAEVVDGPRDRWPAVLRAAMDIRWKPGQRDGVTMPMSVQMAL